MGATHAYGKKKIVKRKPTVTERMVKLFVILMAVVIAGALVFSLTQWMF